MNAIRSPMAAALTKKFFGDQIYVQSAGIYQGDMDGFVSAVMAEEGIDLSDHQPHTLDELDDLYFDLIITLSPEAHHRILDWASDQAVEVIYWPTLDPSTLAGRRDQILEGYRQTRDSLAQRIKQQFGQIHSP